jgi:hypothetical protein
VVGAAATEGVSGVTAASCVRDRPARALERLVSELISDLFLMGAGVSISVDQFSVYPYIGLLDNPERMPRAEVETASPCALGLQIPAAARVARSGPAGDQLLWARPPNAFTR